MSLVGRVDGFELTVDINFFQLVDEDHRRIPIGRDIARRHLYLEPVIRSVTELLHNLAGISAVFPHVGVIS